MGGLHLLLLDHGELQNQLLRDEPEEIDDVHGSTVLLEGLDEEVGPPRHAIGPTDEVMTPAWARPHQKSTLEPGFRFGRGHPGIVA